MLPLSEIARLRGTVDEGWRAPEIDAVAAAWGIAAGTARYWRSSATHVAMVPSGNDERGVLYLRWVPAASSAAEGLVRGAAAQVPLAGAGIAAALLPTVVGSMVAGLEGDRGPVVAIATLRLDGDELDVDELDAAAARRWGGALGRFHEAGADLLERPDPAGTSVADRVLGHGDFELDNLRWSDDAVRCFDLDECGAMNRAEDVASAVRDLVGERMDRPAHPLLLAAFLDGYTATTSSVVTAADLVPELLLVAERGLARLERVRDLDASTTRAQWLLELEHGLRAYEARMRALAASCREVLLAAR